MKKLMFGAAVAATSMVFAATQPAAQVYDVTLNIKSTAAASATLNNKQNPLAVPAGDDARPVIYRKQASYTWKGLVWGCDCEAVNGKWEFVKTCEGEEMDTVKGCIIWDNKDKVPVYMGYNSTLPTYVGTTAVIDTIDEEEIVGTDFGWKFIHAINKDAKQVEGAWEMLQNGLSCDDDAITFHFFGAGFGTAQLTTENSESEGGYVPLCTSYIKKISGNFAGVMIAPPDTTATEVKGCRFCGATTKDGDCVTAEAWDWCKWSNDCDCNTEIEENPDYTAAYGTWTMCYNSSVSKKLSSELKVTSKGIEGLEYYSIRAAYNFKSLPKVAAAIEAIEEYMWNGDEPTECEELATALATANKAVEEANAAVEAVSYTNLKAQVVLAAAKVETTSNAWASAVKAYNTTNDLYNTSVSNYNNAIYAQTNVNAIIIWKNSSQDDITNSVVGCTAITEYIADKQNFTIMMKTWIPGSGSITTNADYTWTDCTTRVKGYTDATKAADEARDALKIDLGKAEIAVKTTKAAWDVAENELVAAQNDLANINLLQYKAGADLEKAETALAVAQAAYEDAGCEDDE